MADVQLPKLETPPNTIPVNEPVIFSMPEKYRGLTAKVNPPLVKSAAVQPASGPPKPAPPPPQSVSPTLGRKMGLAHSTKVLIIAGAALLLVLGAAAVYIFISFKPVEVVKNETPKANTVPTKTNTSNQDSNTSKPTNATNNQGAGGTVVSPFPEGVQPGRDTDSDGLTDVEEILFRTNSKLPDSDSDGFLDGNEVFHGYDPNASSPAKLSDSIIVTEYLSSDNSFSLFYPAAWLARAAEGGQGTVLVAPTGETFSLTSQTKEATTALAAWYSGANPNAATKVVAGKTKQGYSMLTTDEQTTVYIDLGTKIVIFDYQNSLKATSEYLRTFSMMINGLTLVQP